MNYVRNKSYFVYPTIQISFTVLLNTIFGILALSVVPRATSSNSSRSFCSLKVRLSFVLVSLFDTHEPYVFLLWCSAPPVTEKWPTCKQYNTPLPVLGKQYLTTLPGLFSRETTSRKVLNRMPTILQFAISIPIRS